MQDAQAATTPWEELRRLVESGDADAVQAFLDTHNSGEVARALARLDGDSQKHLLRLIEPEDAADLIETLSDAHAADLIEELPADDAAAIVEELESHHRADVLAEMDAADAEAILRQMDPDEAQDARELLAYDPETAGGVMATEFVSYPQHKLVREVVQDLLDNAQTYADYGINYVYVTSERGTLIGVARMRDLLLARGDRLLGEVMTPNPIYLNADSTLGEVDEYFERFPFYDLPVVNSEGVMVGIVRRADLEEALGEQHEKTFMRLSGIIGGEELRTMPLRERSTRRMAWLALNVLLSLIAASVILFFERTVSHALALVFFFPVICNLSGCSGNQSVAVSIRELTLGLIEPGDVFRVWRQELAVGAINGAVIGFILGMVALGLNLLLWHESPWIAPVVGVAFFFNSMLAVTLGGLLPLILRRIGGDAALGAPPIMTTLTDMCGLLLILLLASGAIHFGLL